jgi:hypothetical protein
MLTVLGRIADNLESFFGYMTTTGLLDSMDFPIGLAQDFSLFKFLSKASKPSTKVWRHVRNKQVRSRASLIFQHDSFTGVTTRNRTLLELIY